MSQPGKQTVDGYIAQHSPDVAARLQRLRETILAQIPTGEERIRYGMPAVMVSGRYALHFAAWKHHIGIYPVPVFSEPLETKVSPFRSGKDALRFPHTTELPYNVVRSVCAAIRNLRQQIEV